MGGKMAVIVPEVMKYWPFPMETATSQNSAQKLVGSAAKYYRCIHL